MEVSARWLRAFLLRALPPPRGDDLVPIACRCDPPRAHGPHYVARRRLEPDGDLAHIGASLGTAGH